MSAEVLVTGAMGFVGSAVARKLRESGWSVAGLTRHAAAMSGVRKIPGDLATAEIGIWPTIVFAAGAILKGSDTRLDPLAPAISTNVADSVAFLDRALANGGHLVLISTCDVYGRPRATPIDETHPLAPATYYAASKASQEMFAAIVAARRDATLTILRLAQVYGPGDASRKVIPLLADKFAAGEQPRLSARGESRRSWLYIDDAAEAVRRALTCRVAGVFNIAGGHAHTVAEMAEALCNLAGGAVRPVLESSGTGDDLTVCPRKAADRLRFTAATPLADGLARYWAWRVGRPYHPHAA